MQVDRDILERRTNSKSWFTAWYKGWIDWFSVGTSDNYSASITDAVISSLQAEMTPTEKAKLYSAIGCENVVHTDYPKSFVENRFNFCLNELSILLHDSTNNLEEPMILLSSLSNVEATVEHRPVAKALRVYATVEDILVQGFPLNGEKQTLVCPFQGNNPVFIIID